MEWAHTVARRARILLVEATTSSLTDLLTAEDYATTHANYVSNSWGASELKSEVQYDSHFSNASVSIFVSSGDSGLPAEWPSAAPNVISVVGTTLNFDAAGNFVTETGWSGGRGGCNQYERASSPQSAFPQFKQARCGVKCATPDVSLDPDPTSGVSVYDSTPYNDQIGWYKVGWTSAGAPMSGARSAVAGFAVDAVDVYGSSINYRTS